MQERIDGLMPFHLRNNNNSKRLDVFANKSNKTKSETNLPFGFDTGIEHQRIYK